MMEQRLWIRLFEMLVAAVACLGFIGICCSGRQEHRAGTDLQGQRQRISLNGDWDFRIDPEDQGLREGWYREDRQAPWRDTIEGPGNWNFLFRSNPSPQTDRDYAGVAWYRTTLVPPTTFRGKRGVLHLGAACYRTTLWLNGVYIGTHEGDFLPIEFDVTGALRFDQENLLVARIETINKGSRNTIPHWGWYVGRVSHAVPFLDLAHALFPDKPIVLTEFGAGAIKDNRSTEVPSASPHYSEDYQSYLLRETWERARSREFVCGGFIWVWADFLSPTRAVLQSSRTPPGTPNPLPYHTTI